METLTTRPILEQFKMSRSTHITVETVARFKHLHFSNYQKHFSDKTDGFIISKMFKNGLWKFRWFLKEEEALKELK